MKRLLSLLSLCGVAVAAFASIAYADSQSDQQRRKALLPQVRLTTDCIASEVAKELAQTSEVGFAVPQAIDRVLIRRLCFSAIRSLVDQHDRLMGLGTGDAFVQGPYLADLPRAVSTRLQAAPLAKSEGQPSVSQPPTGPTVEARPAVASRVGSSERETTIITQAIPRRATEAPGAGKSAAEVKEENDAFRKGASLIFVTLAGSTLILFVLGCGSRVVVFADSTDLFMTACIFLAPVAALLGAGTIGYMLSPDNSITYPTTLAMLKDNPAVAFIVVVGGLVWLWGVFGTIISSIRYNGIIFGSVIAFLKIGAVVLLLLIWFGTLHNYDDRNPNQVASKFIVLALLAWFASKFVNGEKVIERRMERSHEREAATLANAGA